MRTKNLALSLTLGLVGLASCAGSATKSETAMDNELAGKSIAIDYGQMKAEVTYIPDSVHWKTYDPAGKPMGEETELVTYSPLGQSRTLVTWQEKDGLVVVQLVDLSQKNIEATIYAPVQPGQTERKALQLTGRMTLK